MTRTAYWPGRGAPAHARETQNSEIEQLHAVGPCSISGPSRRSALLEVVKVVRDGGSELVIHAMPTRAMHEWLLSGRPLCGDLGSHVDRYRAELGFVFG